MKPNAINLIPKEPAPPFYQTYRSPLPKILVIASVFFLMLSGTALFSYRTGQDETSILAQTWQTITRLSPLRGFAENQNSAMLSDDGRINVLLLGIGGGNHEGADLADTMILASILPARNRIAIFSIPRDLLVPIDGYGWRKINNANAFGEMVQRGTGGELASRTVERVFGIPVHYYIRADFRGFADIIDIVGGIPITVDNSFTDYQYPTLDKKYQTVSFSAGPQMMDGETALKFVRSRHSVDNNEGSDFARSRRQQKVITAVREKVFSTALFFRPKKVAEIMDAVKANVSTNMEVWQMLSLGTTLKKINPDDIISVVLDDTENGLLVSETLDGAYVLQPRDSSFAALQDKVRGVFREFPEGATRTVGKNITVAIRNGTTIDGIGIKTAALLKRYDFTVSSVENAREQNYQKTVIFDLAGQKNDKVKTFLADVLLGESIYDPYSPELDTAPQADYLIIMGSDLPPTLAQSVSPAVQ